MHPSSSISCRQRRALDGVLGNDPGVVALPGRVVDVGLAGLGVGPGLVGGEADRRVPRREHRQAGLVEDRDRDRRGARVEGAEVGDRGVVLRRPPGVRGLGLRRPLPGLGGRVVERLEVDRHAAGLVVGLLERELDAVLDRQPGRPRGALQGQARVDRHLAGAATLFLVVAAAGGETKRKGQGHHEDESRQKLGNPCSRRLRLGDARTVPHERHTSSAVQLPETAVQSGRSGRCLARTGDLLLVRGERCGAAYCPLSHNRS